MPRNCNNMSETEQDKRPRRGRARRVSTPANFGANKAEAVPPKTKAPRKPGFIAPTKAETALLPDFPVLTMKQVHVPKTQAECRKAVKEILAAGITGFDTEAKPTFHVGQKSDGPHVVQFALTDKAFIFQLHRKECENACSELISSRQLLKVGFGLKNDHSQIRSRLGISLNHVLDLDQVFRKQGYRQLIGVRGAIGILFEQSFKKSKATTTSNWALPELSEKQLLDAANDAYAARKIMEALQAASPDGRV